MAMQNTFIASEHQVSTAARKTDPAPIRAFVHHHETAVTPLNSGMCPRDTRVIDNKVDFAKTSNVNGQLERLKGLLVVVVGQFNLTTQDIANGCLRYWAGRRLDRKVFRILVFLPFNLVNVTGF